MAPIESSRPQEPGLREESVWDYPRPPRLETCSLPLRVYLGDVLIASTTRGLRLLETSHPPTYYIPPTDVRMERLSAVGGGSFCEFKGEARYFDIAGPNGVARRAAWSYPAPTDAYADLADCLAFYASKMTACWVGSEQVQAQDGDFYGGWLTSNLKGPFKGGPGTWGW